MERKLKVLEFNRKHELLEFVNENTNKLEVVTITSTQVAISYKHFLWYYDK